MNTHPPSLRESGAINANLGRRAAGRASGRPVPCTQSRAPPVGTIPGEVPAGWITGGPHRVPLCRRPDG